MRHFVSRSTRNEFREVLTGYTLREIVMTFDAGGLCPRADYQPTVGGQRRGLVEAYYADIDFAPADDLKKLLAVFEQVIENLNRASEHQQVVNHDAVAVALVSARPRAKAGVVINHKQRLELTWLGKDERPRPRSVATRLSNG